MDGGGAGGCFFGMATAEGALGKSAGAGVVEVWAAENPASNNKDATQQPESERGLMETSL